MDIMCIKYELIEKNIETKYGARLETNTYIYHSNDKITTILYINMIEINIMGSQITWNYYSFGRGHVRL